jgi:hypothetical protein
MIIFANWFTASHTTWFINQVAHALPEESRHTHSEVCVWRPTHVWRTYWWVERWRWVWVWVWVCVLLVGFFNINSFTIYYTCTSWFENLKMYSKFLLCITLMCSVGVRSVAASEPKAIISERCTSIAVGRKASKDGSTMATHTSDCAECDWRIAK